MRKKYIYSGGERGYITAISNRALARVRAAKKEVVKSYPVILLSLMALAAGTTMFVSGITTTPDEAFTEIVEVSDQNMDFADNIIIEAEDAASPDMDLVKQGVASTALGALTSVTGLAIAVLGISDLKRRLFFLRSNIDSLSTFLTHEVSFNRFLMENGLRKAEFLQLHVDTKANIIEKYLESHEKLLGYEPKSF